jgi:hypothetical protein
LRRVFENVSNTVRKTISKSNYLREYEPAIQFQYLSTLTDWPMNMSQPLVVGPGHLTVLGHALRIASFTVVLAGMAANAAWITMLLWLVYRMVADSF